MRLELSQSSKDMIKRSREIALDLGYDYISTIHFMLAEMKTDGILKLFLSEKVKDFDAFFETARTGPPITMGDVPLTKEAERSLKMSVIEAFVHSSKLVEPYHIVLASLKIKNSELKRFFTQEGFNYHDMQLLILNNWYIKGHTFKYSWNRFFYLPWIRKVIVGKLDVKYDKPYWIN